MAKQKTSQKVFIGILAVMTAVTLAGAGGIFGGGGGVSPHQGAPATTLDGVPNQTANTSLSNVPCLTGGNFHLHPQFTILLDGDDVPLPADIGVSRSCVQEIHTHEPDGVIHVESDVDKGYTFADFLGVWGFPLDQAGFVTRLTVNGEFNDNDINFLFEDGQEIVLEYITLPDFAAPQGDATGGAVPAVE